MLGLTQPAVLSRNYSYRLPFVSIDGTRLGSSAFPISWRSQKIDQFMDRLKRRIIFSRWNSKIAWKTGKSCNKRWTILWLICSYLWRGGETLVKFEHHRLNVWVVSVLFFVINIKHLDVKHILINSFILFWNKCIFDNKKTDRINLYPQ